MKSICKPFILQGSKVKHMQTRRGYHEQNVKIDCYFVRFLLFVLCKLNLTDLDFVDSKKYIVFYRIFLTRT